MQRQDSPINSQKSSQFVSRRLILKTALAGTAVFSMQMPAANAAPATPDEMDRLLAEYEANRKRRDVVNRELERLESTPDCPRQAFIKLRDFASKEFDYHPEFRNEIFVSERQIDLFFARIETFSNILIPAINDRRRADCERGKTLVRKVTTAHTEWEQSSGYAALEKEYNTLYDRQTYIEDEICTRPCENISQVLRKALFAASWLDGPEPDNRIWALVGTIADFAKGRDVDEHGNKEIGPTDPALLARIDDHKLAAAAFSLSVYADIKDEINDLPPTSPDRIEYERAHEALFQRLRAAEVALLKLPCHTIHDIRVKARHIAGDDVLSDTAGNEYSMLLEALCNA